MAISRSRNRLGALLKRSAVRADYWQEKRLYRTEPPVRRYIRLGIIPAIIIVLVLWLVFGKPLPSPFAGSSSPTATSTAPEAPPDPAMLNKVINGVGQFQVTSEQLLLVGSNWKPKQTEPPTPEPFNWSASATATVSVDFASLPPLASASLDMTNHIAHLPPPVAQVEIKVDESSFAFKDKTGKVVKWNPEGEDLALLAQETKAQARTASVNLAGHVEQNARAWLTDLLKAHGFAKVEFH